MAANYPASLPVKAAAGANLSTNPHSTLHDDMYDEIVAIATELGTSPKGTAASVRARLDALPRGVVGRGSRTTSQGAITSTMTEVSAVSATFTATAGRLYRATAYGLVVSDGADTRAKLFIVRGGLTLLLETVVPALSGGPFKDTGASVTWVGELSGTVTLALHAAAQGATNITVTAAAASPASIVVEDIGLA